MIGPYFSHPGTLKGFERMKQKGAILPPFRIQDIVTRLVQAELDFLTDRMAQELARISIPRVHGYVADAVPEWLENFIRRVVNVIHSIRRPNFQDAMLRQILAAEGAFFLEFLSDADPVIGASIQFAINSDLVFKNKLAALRNYYFDTALSRIEEGLSDARLRFVKKLESWASGKSDLSELPAIIKETKAENTRFALYFARDQFARFNKALTLASFDQAGIKRLRWWTVMDGRVRKSHRELHGKVFNSDDLPLELSDFNCRCALLPVFDEEVKK